MRLAEELKASIFQSAIEGKLTKREETDENVDELLDQIRNSSEMRSVTKRKRKEFETPFEIPEEWRWCSIDDFCYRFAYGTAKKSAKTGLMPVLRMGNLIDGELDFTDLVYTSDPDDIEKFSLEAGDLLFNRTNSREKVGKVAIYRGQRPAIYAGYLVRFTPVLVEPEYVNLVMQSKYYWDYCQSVKLDAIGQSNINAQKLKAFMLPLPSRQEQRRIVEKLKDILVDIKDYETTEQQLFTLKKEFPGNMRDAILQAAMQGKLTEQLESDTDPYNCMLEAEKLVSEKLDGQRVKVKEIKRIEDQDIPYEIPDNWRWVRLGSIAIIARGGSPRPISNYITSAKDGVNWIKIGDTEKNGKYISSTTEKIKPEGARKSRFVHAGDFLLTNSMSYGRPYILKTDGCIHDGWLVISQPLEVYNQDFLYWLLSSDIAYSQFADTAAGGVVKNLNSDKVANSLFPVPPIEEQRRIVSRIEEIIPDCDDLQQNI